MARRHEKYNPICNSHKVINSHKAIDLNDSFNRNIKLSNSSKTQNYPTQQHQPSIQSNCTKARVHVILTYYELALAKSLLLSIILLAHVPNMIPLEGLQLFYQGNDVYRNGQRLTPDREKKDVYATTSCEDA